MTDKKFGSQANTIMRSASVPVKTKKIIAGKFRRFHRVSIFKQLLHLPTLLLNLRDLFFTGIGALQSLWLLWRFKPDVVFAKGGFVCVPLGLAAHWLKIPLVIHDSDAHPGLANRILSRWATSIATGSPLENYPYPLSRSHYVGIPVNNTFRPVKTAERQRLKGVLGLHDTKKPLVVVTGGGLGARNINRAVTAIAPQLLDKAAIVHITGNITYQETIDRAPEHIDYLIKPFISAGMAPLFGAADIVITRAGATTMQELASMAKAVIIVPNPFLTGGHQLKNAAVYEKAGAAVVVDEDELVTKPTVLRRAINDLLDDPRKRAALGARLYRFARPEAAVDMAGLIVEAAATRKHQQSVE